MNQRFATFKASLKADAVLPYNYLDMTLVLIHQSIVIICVLHLHCRLIENYVNAPDSRPPTPQQVTTTRKRGHQRSVALCVDGVTGRRRLGVRRSRRQDNCRYHLTQYSIT